MNLEDLLIKTITLNNMIKEELQHECKHAENSRCRAGQWGGVARYINYAFGVPCSEEELKEAVKDYFRNALK